MKMLMCLIRIAYHKEALGHEGMHCETRPSVMVSEGSLIHCFCLLREFPRFPWRVVGGQTERQTVPVQYSPSVLSGGLYVSELRHVQCRLKGI